MGIIYCSNTENHEISFFFPFCFPPPPSYFYIWTISFIYVVPFDNRGQQLVYQLVCVGKLDIIHGGSVNDIIPSGYVGNGYCPWWLHGWWIPSTMAVEDGCLLDILLVTVFFIKTESNFKFKRNTEVSKLKLFDLLSYNFFSLILQLFFFYFTTEIYI